MANQNDQNITELPIKTNTGVASTDYMLGIDSAEGYQILVRDVAKYIVENYNGSSLAGVAQTPKSAIDALNESMPYASNTTIISYVREKVAAGNKSGHFVAGTGVTDTPTSDLGWNIWYTSNQGTSTILLTARGNFGASLIPAAMYSSHIASGTTELTWTKQPTRAEITELNSNLATASTKNSGNLGENITGWVDYVQFGKIVLVQFVLTNAAALTSNSKIVTGLPRPDRSYTIGDFKLFNSNAYFRIADDGSVVVTGNIASGANLRGAVTYIAN